MYNPPQVEIITIRNGAFGAHANLWDLADERLLRLKTGAGLEYAIHALIGVAHRY